MCITFGGMRCGKSNHLYNFFLHVLIINEVEILM
jgi:hypothetical protein